MTDLHEVAKENAERPLGFPPALSVGYGATSEGQAHLNDDGSLKEPWGNAAARAKVDSWRTKWMVRAEQLAQWSKDPSRKVGCILVLDQHAVAEGYNGFPHGVNDSDERLLERATKYDWTIHAEANAVAHAARYGHQTNGAMAYVTFPPCPSCATLLTQAGVRTIVVKVPSRCVWCANGYARLWQPSGYYHEVKAASGGGMPVDYTTGCAAHPTEQEWLHRYTTSKLILEEAGVVVVEV